MKKGGEHVHNSDCQIQSKQDNNCFLQWQKRRTDSVGNIDPISRSEIFKLLGLTPSQGEEKLSEAVRDLREMLKGAV